MLQALALIMDEKHLCEGPQTKKAEFMIGNDYQIVGARSFLTLRNDG